MSGHPDYPEFDDFEDFIDDDFDDELDEWEEAFDECGKLPPHLGGGCTLAGTEHCDFECPFRDSNFEDE